MVFLGSLEGSNTASIDSLTTTGLVTTTALRIGPATTVEETINNVWYGYRGSITGVSDTGGTLVIVSVPGMVSSDSIYVTPYYSGGAPFPSLYARVYDKTTGSFRVLLRLDDETPGTKTCAFYWLIFD
jgi:hypothetical protein